MGRKLTTGPGSDVASFGVRHVHAPVIPVSAGIQSQIAHLKRLVRAFPRGNRCDFQRPSLANETITSGWIS